MKIDECLLSPSGAMPNHPNLPVLIYSVIGGANSSSFFEALFAKNGWHGIWRNGVFSYHHYHTTAHEVLGVGCGTARLQIGGPDGPIFDVGQGDCLLLPAGTGHKRLESSDDFQVVGAYPDDGEVDIQRDIATDKMLARIKAVPIPVSDPVVGPEGGLLERWAVQ